MTVLRPGHCRVLAIPYQDFERWLNLPEGFEVVHVRNEYDSGQYELAVSCPREPRFETEPGKVIPRIGAYVTTVTRAVETLYWPDLGQTHPEE